MKTKIRQSLEKLSVVYVAPNQNTLYYNRFEPAHEYIVLPPDRVDAEILSYLNTKWAGDRFEYIGSESDLGESNSATWFEGPGIYNIDAAECVWKYGDCAVSFGDCRILSGGAWEFYRNTASFRQRSEIAADYCKGYLP